MPVQSIYWVLLMMGLYILMFVVVPPRQGPELARFGCWFGLFLALAVMWTGQVYFKAFRVIGDIPLFSTGIPILISITWIPPAIIFAKYFPKNGNWFDRLVYLELYATGAVIVQYLLSDLGMWESIRWNLFKTFLLANFTHLLMTIYLSLRQQRILD